MRGRTVVELATDLTAGAITEEWIREELGEGVLNNVLAFSGGIVAGGLASVALSVIDRETGIVSDVASVVDDLFSIF